MFMTEYTEGQFRIENLTENSFVLVADEKGVEKGYDDEYEDEYLTRCITEKVETTFKRIR